MASSSPLKLTIEEQVPFTPPRSLTRSFIPTPNSGEITRSGSLDSRSFSSTPGEEEEGENLENVESSKNSNRSTGGEKKGRRRGCGLCSGCQASDCGKCRMCKDKVKFGGPGIKKKRCLYRKCRHLMVKSPSLTPMGERNRKRQRDDNDQSLGDTLSPITSVKKRRCSARNRIPSSSSESSNQSSSDSCIIVNTDPPPTGIQILPPTPIAGISPPTHSNGILLPSTSPPTHITSNQPPTHRNSNDNNILPPTHIRTNQPPTQADYITSSPTKTFKCPTLANKRKNWLSPRKGSPLKPSSTLATGSPRKRAAVLRKNPFSVLAGRQTVAAPFIDCAPFNNLVHLRQEEDLAESHTTSSVLGNRLRLVPDRLRPMLSVPETKSLSLGSITMANVSHKRKEASEQNNKKNENNGVILSEEGLGLFKRYQTLCKQLPCGPSSCQDDGIKDNHKPALPALPLLKVSVYILKRKRREKKRKIMVDRSHYDCRSTTRRQSKRLREKEEKEEREDNEEQSMSPTEIPEAEEKEEEEKEEEEKVQVSRFGQDLWTDHYQPRVSDEVIGNKSSVSKLLNWLTQWKDVCLGKSPFPTSLPDSVSPSSSVQSEEDIPRLVPAMILSGPVGVGKTACVYACAQELGYRVLEINSTHSRSRSGIISLLREATLSHQVSLREKNDKEEKQSTLSFPPPPPPAKKGLFSFFSPKSATPSLPPPPVQKKDKGDGVGGCGQQGKVVGLETATLVLLEEVDILFDEEGRGFWLGVYDVLVSSKRPIIFTTNETELKLDTPYQSISMTTPTQEEVSLHARLLSMSHDYHMTKEEANQITGGGGCDIRKVFNTLQFWLAGHASSNEPKNLMGMVQKKSHDPILLLVSGTPFNEPCLPYHELDQAVTYSDASVTIDIMRRGMDSGMEPDSSWWWMSKTSDSLSDELSECSSSVLCDEITEEWESVFSSSMGMGDCIMGNHSDDSLEWFRHKDEVHKLQGDVGADVFHVRTVLSRQSLMTECLPVLHLICQYEDNRESAKTSRRFTHYLNQNNLDHLKQFLRSGKLSI